MKDKICHVVCAGVNKGLNLKLNCEDFLIAADGGWDYLKAIGVSPNLTVGDFDSNKFQPSGEIVKLNCDKNETDTFICVLEGLKRGYETFFIHCGTGARFDHTLANLQILTYLANKNAQGYLFDEEQIITSLPEKREISFSKNAVGDISIFSASDACYRVKIKGLKYNLRNGSLNNSFALGVSNSFIGQKSCVSAEKGVLTVVFPSAALQEILN